MGQFVRSEAEGPQIEQKLRHANAKICVSTKLAKPIKVGFEGARLWPSLSQSFSLNH